MLENQEKDVVEVPKVDGLGICRRCKHTTSSDALVLIGSKIYLETICLKKKIPCYKIRSSLAKCNYFIYPNDFKKNLMLWIYRKFLWILRDKT
jgi:hypothetical protein